LHLAFFDIFFAFFALLLIPKLLSFVYIPHRLGRPMLIAEFTTSLSVGIYILARIILFLLGFTTLRLALLKSKSRDQEKVRNNISGCLWGLQRQTDG